MAVTVALLSRAEMTSRMPEALGLYVAAMGYPRGTEAQRGPVWAAHCARPGWRAFGAVDDAGDLLGIAYGYRGALTQWWGGQVRNGLLAGATVTHSAASARHRYRPERPGAGAIDTADVHGILTDYFELTELHVSPTAQGRGIGDSLLAALLADCPQRHVLLSTPEVAGEDNRAWRLYRRRGFTDLLRGFTFAGDPRPFAVLGRALPL